ncbi:hypothetical protein PHMEG_00016043 [Phytophthora megakarya]|uniref:Reverse transcriptase RNase H-like domain-containing protein n=1 Tax=Phytophthora megakarya TaxID=4795 RepID=A0A225W1A8_9STRA|nr:hypothetical protein PHMEG_00016043 [Phytophthora megakarya]
MSLHKDSQEIFSFMRDDTIYTPTRVPQGVTDSALRFQNQIQFVFDPLLYITVLILIDDVILFAKILDEFMCLLREFNLKLHIMKCNLYEVQVNWCGHLISRDRVEHDPAQVEALQALPLPATERDVQYFLCAANWQRESIVDYARHAVPLQDKLDTALKGTSTRRQHALRIPLTWNDIVNTAFLPDPSQEICMFTDTSDIGYSIVVTQVADWKDELQAKELQYQLLGTSQLNWSIVEKEAFPIVQACTTLEYLLQRSNDFKLYCNHANLISIFAPDNDLKKHARANLQRWAMLLTGYIYTIEHIPGASNLWADIVSKWSRPRERNEATKKISHVRTRRPVSPLRPLEDNAFEWPTREALMEAQ